MRQSHCPASLIQRQPRQGHGLRPLPALDRSGVCWIVPLDIDLGAEVKITSHTDFLTLPAFWKQSHNTTCIRSAGSGEAETVTVTDPRHPLFGQTFRLITTTLWRRTTTCCVVWLQDEGIERLIPLTATDRSPRPPTIFPTILDVAAVQRLVRGFSTLAVGANLLAEVAGDVGQQSTAGSADSYAPSDVHRNGVAH